MPIRCLPREPNLEQLRTLAKTLQRLARSGEVGAVELVREFHPRLGDAEAGSPEMAGLSRADMQLALARSYGFASWPKLRDHVVTVNRLTRNPHRQPVGELVDGAAGLADEFLRLACLNYGADDPARPARARALLAENPGLATATVHTAAAVGHVERLRELLAADPAAASSEGGPYDWEPLLYLVYSRLDSTDPAHSPVEAAQLLLEAGADPNAGYLWESEYPFTALTGVFGEGENGVNTPPHAQSSALARLLLAAGADPNDSQTLYNRQWSPADDHVEILVEFGLGRGTSTVWQTRLGADDPTPQDLVEEELRKAAEGGRLSRIRLLLPVVDDVDGLGADHPLRGGRPARDLALLHGHTEIAELLEAAGANPRPLTPIEQLQAACLRGDRPAMEQLVAGDPSLPGQLIAANPDLLGVAAELDRIDAIRLLVAIGFDLNPTDRRTPLHEAAFRGNLALAKALIDLGSDPTLRDPHHDSTPAGWANHNQQHDVARYLTTLA